MQIGELAYNLVDVVISFFAGYMLVFKSQFILMSIFKKESNITITLVLRLIGIVTLIYGFISLIAIF